MYGYDKLAELRGGQTAGYLRNRVDYPISDYNADIHRFINELLKTRQQVHLLDVGAGDANFLNILKFFFRERLQVTTMGLMKNKALDDRLSRGGVDRVLTRSLEGFVPDREYDLIMSYWGGMHYVTPELRTHYCETLANSLSKGGIFVIYPYNKAEITLDSRFEIQTQQMYKDSREEVAIIRKTA